jgi:hypothetical protein
VSEPYYGWAVDAVEGLDWLVELDDWAFAGRRENLGSRDPKLIDVAHVRWATSTAVTALDLCGVELAVRHGDVNFWTDHAPVLDQVSRRVDQAGGALPEWAQDWLTSVQSDPSYKTLKALRDPLTHRFVVRTALLWTAPPQGHQWRTEFDVPKADWLDARPNARQVVVLARDVAASYVKAFGEYSQ